MIQADFLLSASREEIDASSLWNKALLKKIPEAFCQAVEGFNTTGLRYTWIKFLQERSSVSDFFSPLEEAIFKALSTSPVVESQNGELMIPSKLRTVPAAMLGEDGQPLVPTDLFGSKYISPKYPLETHRAELNLLGVKDVTPEEFIDDLAKFIKSSPIKFRKMPPTWHSSLCKLLCQFSESKNDLKAKVAELELVPLRGGQWTSSSQDTLYFSDEKNNGVQIPNGISMTEIDFEAASDLSRRNLFMLLGARMWTKEKVCQAIISTHAGSPFFPLELSREDLVSHVVFLFDANWTRVKPKCLWLSTESGAVKPSFDAYFDSDKPSSASTLFGQNRKLFSFIHSDYMAVPTERLPQLKSWMGATLGVAEFPRLVTQSEKDPCFSDDFQFLLDNSKYISVLLLLRDNWDHYANWITKEKKTTMKCIKQAKEAIGNMVVSCEGGSSTKLRNTLLPTPNTKGTNLTGMSFLEIPDPEHPQWKQLLHFGVVVTAGIGPFIKCLEMLKDSNSTKEKASELYRQLYTQCNLDQSLIP
jgi:hypothetical protein